MAIEIIVPNGVLQLTKEFPIPLNYNIDDIKDITKKDGSYSKTIKIPGTKNNNILMGHLFDVNSDFTFFNPNFKTDAKLLVDSSIIMDGYLELKKINIDRKSDQQGNRIFYDIVIYNKRVDFWTEMGDGLLTDLDFSDLNHTYTKDNIVASWSHKYEDEYMYPMTWNSGNNFFTNNFRPAIFHKAYLRKIADLHNFSIGGSFFESWYYSKEIIPNNTSDVLISGDEFERRKFRAGTLTNKELFNVNHKSIFMSGFDSGITKLEAFDEDNTPPDFFDNGFTYDTTTHTWTADRNGIFDFNSDLNIEIDWTTRFDVILKDNGSGNVRCTHVGHNLPDGLEITIDSTVSYNGNHIITVIDADNFDLLSQPFILSEAGFYAYDAYKYRYSFLGGSQQDDIDHRINEDSPYKLRVSLLKNGVVEVIQNQDFSFPSATGTDSTFNITNNYLFTESILVNLSRPNLSVSSGDTVTLEYSIFTPENEFNNGQYRDGAELNISAVEFTTLNVPVDITLNVLSSISNLRNTPHRNILRDEDDIILNDFIPRKIKQKDLFTDLINRYNLYITTDPDNPRKLILETRDDYYARGTTLDYTNKKDYNTPDSVTLLSQLRSKEMLFTYKADSDEKNKKYTEFYDEIYGQKEIEFDNEFVEGEEKIETPFSPTPLVYDRDLSPNKIVSHIPSHIPEKTNIRVLHYGGLKDTLDGTSWDFFWINNGVRTKTPFTRYPYAGHLDDPLNPSLDINFGKVRQYFDENQVVTDATLYERFWSNYINQINEGRLVTSKFNLNEVDISFLKDNLNTKIFIKDSYYFINKIVDYDASSNGLTTMELLKIVDGVPFVSEPGVIEEPIGRYELSYRLGVTETEGTTTNGVQTGVNPENTVLTDRTIVNGDGNYVDNSTTTITVGNDNKIFADSDNSGIIGGNRNVIEPGVTNAWVIGADDKVITKSNEIWVGNLHIVDGVVQNNFNLIRGGIDNLLNLFAASPINFVTGGTDELRTITPTNVINLVRGGVDSL